MCARLPEPYRPVLLRSSANIAVIGVLVDNPRFGRPGDTLKVEWLFSNLNDVVDWRDIPRDDDVLWRTDIPDLDVRILCKYRTPSGIIRHIIEDASSYRIHAAWLGGAGWMPLDAVFASLTTINHERNIHASHH